MSAEIKGLKPEMIWHFFYDLTRIPRPSKKEAGAIEYVRNFGENRGLETLIDEVGNVIIRKAASPGMENRKMVVLQGHLDMVPQKNSDKQHDFEKDPVETVIDGEWVCARGTTLGADNGIGVAAALAVLDSDELVHGPLEALFTIDEETGMTGAFGLKPGVLNGDIMLNLDSEDEGELYVGCAGGMDANITYTCAGEKVPGNSLGYRISVGGLKGGHSGMDIVLGRGNANKLLFRLLKHAAKEFDAKLAVIDGGGLRNAIPREALADIVIPAERENQFEKAVGEYGNIYRHELSGVDPDFYLKTEKIALPSSIIDGDTMNRLIHGIIACPNGVMRMSDSVPGLVETSTNLARIRSGQGKIEVQCLMRSSVDSSRNELAGMIESLFTLAGAKVSFDGAYPGWKPNMDSGILSVMKSVYQKLYGNFPGVKAIHAGLECGLIGGVYPALDMISFGPTIRNPHSPDEKVHIGSVGKFWDFLVETLKSIPVKQ